MLEKNKHIVILTPGFPENESDTTCIPALQLYVKALHGMSDYDITIISFHYPPEKTKYHWHGIPVYPLGSASGLSKIRLWRRANVLLKQIHQQQKITILHSFWLGECALVANWFSKKRNIRHVTTLMGQDALKGNIYAKLLPLKKLRLISLSRFHQQTFSDNYSVKTEIIPWGIPPGNPAEAIEKNIDFISVGSLIPLKNHNLFIDIIAAINKTKPIKAVIIGDGILRKQLEKKIQLLGLENTILLKGKLPYRETLREIAKAKILLHTSHYESFGMVFAEALQNKTMIVSGKIGCYFPSPGWETAVTEKEMTATGLKLLSHPFSEDIQNPYTIEQTVQAYNAIYNE